MAPGATPPPSQGTTVLREQNLDRRNTTGQASPSGAARGGVTRPLSGAQVQPQGVRQWNRPEPTIQEVPGGDDQGDGAQPQPVIAPPAGGVYYRPGIQSTGRLNMLVVPDWARKGGRR
jgi:hypothetical protein